MNMTEQNSKKAYAPLAALEDLGDTISKLDALSKLINCVKADYQEVMKEVKRKVPEAVE